MITQKSHFRSARIMRPRLGKALGLRSSLREALDAQNAELLLTGSSIGLLFAGFSEQMYLLLGYTPRAYVVSMPMLAVALTVGIWLARRIASVRPRVDHHKSDLQGGERRAVTASLANLTAALIIFFLPNWMTAAESVSDLLFGAFLWSRESVVVLDVVVSAIAVLPAVIVGVVLANWDRQATSQAGLSRTATMVAGGGIALVLLGALGNVDLVVRAGVRLAAAPLLLSSVWIVSRRQSPVPTPRRAAKADAIQEPELRNRWPTLLRLTVGITVICAAGAGAMWTHVATAMHAGSFRVTMAAAGLAVAGVAIGLRLAIREEDAGSQIADCGAACTLGGIAMAAAILVFGAVNSIADSPFRQSIGFAGLFFVCVAPATLLIGRAIGLTEMAVVRRSDAERSGSRFDHVLLICGAVGFSAVAWMALRYLGSFTALAAIALTLLSVGGVLLIHDPAGATEGRRRRVAVTFAAILTMMVTLPSVQNGWLRNRQYRNAGLVESWWATMASTPEGTALLYGDKGNPYQPQFVEVYDAAFAGGESELSMTPGWIVPGADHCVLGQNRSTTGEGRSLPWMEQLSRCRDRHAKMTIVLSGLPNDLLRRVCSAGGLDAALAKIVPGGRLTLVTSNADRGVELRRIVAARFEQHGAKCVAQFVIEPTGELATEFVLVESSPQLRNIWRHDSAARPTNRLHPQVAAASQ